MKDFYSRVNDWYRRGYAAVVVNGQKEYMPPFCKRLRAAGLECHSVYSGKKPYRLCSIYVKEGDVERGREICRGLPSDWYDAMKMRGSVGD